MLCITLIRGHFVKLPRQPFINRTQQTQEQRWPFRRLCCVLPTSNLKKSDNDHNLPTWPLHWIQSFKKWEGLSLWKSVWHGDPCTSHCIWISSIPSKIISSATCTQNHFYQNKHEIEMVHLQIMVGRLCKQLLNALKCQVTKSKGSLFFFFFFPLPFFQSPGAFRSRDCENITLTQHRYYSQKPFSLHFTA